MGCAPKQCTEGTDKRFEMVARAINMALLHTVPFSTRVRCHCCNRFQFLDLSPVTAAKDFAGTLYWSFYVLLSFLTYCLF